jgi:uncharacterized membrane protein AbrB (regulator of aidB expression)
METLKAAALKLIDVPNLLGAAILIAWLGMLYLHYEVPDALSNVVLIIVGYIWGSSAGSKAKDNKAAAP